DLNLFIEECSCSSPWHDPGRMAGSSVSFPGQESGKKAWTSGARNTSDMGLNESTDEHPITIYPNPFDGQLQLSGLPEKTQVEIQIKGVDSRVYWYDKQISNEWEELSLKVDELQKGVYFLTLRFEGNVEIFKIFKE
ncbi:MAG: T9SS type A sorting domain-containing protein, partial [Schleiferiaceae bacterium]|nr:T9SS type A sorting domain-containing protein [Schleiferiaceae bacterium]